MPSVVLQQVSSAFARKNARGTLEKPVGLRFIEKYLDPSLLEALRNVATDGAVHIWGAKLERSHQFVKMFPRESFVFFRRGRMVFAHGAVAETTFNVELAESLWGRDSDGETWPFIFFLKRIVPINKEAANFNKVLGRKPSDNWQGMNVIYVKDSLRLQAYFATEFGDEV